MDGGVKRRIVHRSIGDFMEILFSQSAPQDSSVTAHVTNAGALPKDLELTIAKGAEAARFKGNAGQLFEGFAERDGSVTRIALAGAGAVDATERSHNLERAGAALATKYQSSGADHIALDASGLGAAELISVLTGIRLRNWRWDDYRTTMKAEQKVSLAKVTVMGAPDNAATLWSETSAVLTGVEFTRELVTEPANILYPESFVERCEERFKGTGVVLEVLDEDQMEALGMGALLGVGQGSRRASRILAISWSGGKPGDAPLAFVGKGVTFDTGGISLKPPPGMGDMKWDMGGAGAVAGAMLALAGRKAKANVVGVVGLVENMPDGNAQRPGDVVTSMSGQTIEVLNTDAEGRLVLCDVLHWTQKTYSPKRVVDFATLTGAMMVALGNEHGGLFANDDALADDLLRAGGTSGDSLWRMPLGAAYDKQINSPIADMKNMGGKWAGSITAAQFLQRFILPDVAWAHCDIAGMVWADKPGLVWGKGATGYGVRLMDQLVRDTAE
jgi:leucyl aminopeptidase